MRKARSNYKVCECEYEYMEKFQLSLQNLNNLWSFIEVYAAFVPNLCGEKFVPRKSVWRKNDKYEVCVHASGSVSEQVL